ncbi:hypothetical protein [Burkholderia cenocepacia]|uniref:hypothetical protein n=1 Tax=Burkholderia cenocepacia TaxID=95486 RepID=UPI0022308B6D|nr:hypothetical protein [Burkholderia cenocepacia]MCW3610624.1 hypothetical protein [Burkholderia cenocepacia]MCW5191716.1 hypothetical protein [Burkholderia cenocepacia]
MIPQTTPAERLSSEIPNRYYVKTRIGKMVPLAIVVPVSDGSHANALAHFDRMR